MAQVSKLGSKKIAVLVAESSRMGCQLLADALNRSPHRLHVVACVQTAQDALREAGKRKPVVALISNNLEGGANTSLQALEELRLRQPGIASVLLVDSAERPMIVGAFRAGARGVFSRSNPPKTLAKCVRAVHSGQIWANSRELQFLLEALAQSNPPRFTDAKGKVLLTKREHEISQLVTEGMTNREVSSRLNLSEHTVKNHLFRLFEKLGISSRMELMLYAMQNRPTLSAQDRPAQQGD
jgi:two-component system nitrate/nitrite response regulator NarL